MNLSYLCLTCPGLSQHDHGVPTDWNALAAAIRERRDELGLTQEQVAARGGPSTATLRLLEGALQTSYRHRTYVDLDRALGWPSGHARAVLTGTASVQPPGEAAGYVSDRGSATADDEILEMVRDARTRLDEIERRLRPEPVEGPD